MGPRAELKAQVKVKQVHKTRILKTFGSMVIVQNSFQFPKAYFWQFLTRCNLFLVAICKKDL